MPKPKFRYMTVHGTSLIKVQCVEYQWICHDKLYKLMANFFKTSNLFELLAENQRIFKRITRLGLCNLGWEGICVDHWSALVLVMLAPLFNRGGILFSSSQTNFQACHTTHTYIIWTGHWQYIPKLIQFSLYHILQMNSWTSFLSYIFDVLHHWILLNGLYKLMESFFQIRFWIFARKLKNIQTNKRHEYWSKEMYYISMDLTRQALQTNVKLFSNFGIIFQISYNFLK